MRRIAPLSLLLLLPAMAAVSAEPPTAVDAGDRIEVRGDGYVAILSKSAGGLLASLTSADGKTTFLANHGVYSDYGLYAQRGYVGTKNEAHPEVSLRREGDAWIVSSKGALRGQPAEGQKPIPYQVTYAFDSSRIAVACEVVPIESEKETGAFLATCFTVPAMREWAVNTVDGIVREDVRETGGRSYEAQKLWIHPETPEVGFINAGGSSLRVGEIRCPDSPDLQNIIIHGRTLFLAYLSSVPAPIKSAPLWVSFVLVTGRGDPMR